MILATRRAVMACACALASFSAAQAQGSAAGACRQGVLALIVMIEAGEHDKSHYRSTATSVVKTCGPPSALQHASSDHPFDKATCGNLAFAMLDRIGESTMGSPQFVQVRDEFAAKCVGK